MRFWPRGWTPRSWPRASGVRPATIRKKLRLLNLGDEAMGLLREHGLCEGYAQALLRVPGHSGAPARAQACDRGEAERDGYGTAGQRRAGRACPFLWLADGI